MEANGLIVTALFVVIVVLLVARARGRKKQQQLRAEILDLKQRIDPLLKYVEIEDASIEAARLHKEADTYAQETKAQAQHDAIEIRAEATEFAKSKKQRSSEELDRAIAESRRILEQAEQRAREIAGSAMEAKGKSEHYERAARAMKNIIDGYGDEYLIANITVLDELAEDFGHKEAGAELKTARKRTRDMVKGARAATCDYKEERRKSTAIQFVLDAFNGKVDTALAKVRHDNYGKLRQEIEDGYALVNRLGEAFKNARITPEYRDARLEELRWAVAVNELKIQEREEQRRIKEAMREEEKARREYEKAIREAEKEERMLQKALRIAQKELEDAAEDQRHEFERKLAELQQQLDEAEAKNQRALSMAQQTRRGHVYVISNIGSFGEDVFKIGLTRRLEPLDRVRELGDASVPFSFDVHAMIHSEDAPALETELHKKFAAQQVNKVNSRKEFFRIGIGSIRDLIDTMGIEAHWTMRAEAKEYRETMALEEASSSSSSSLAHHTVSDE